MRLQPTRPIWLQRPRSARRRTRISAQEKDLVETIDTLERAIGIIEKGMNCGASMMQLKQSGSVVQALSAMVSAEAISSSDGKGLTALLQSNSDDDDSGALAAAFYESSSGGVVGVLHDLLEKAKSELRAHAQLECRHRHGLRSGSQQHRPSLLPPQG